MTYQLHNDKQYNYFQIAEKRIKYAAMQERLL